MIYKIFNWLQSIRKRQHNNQSSREWKRKQAILDQIVDDTELVDEKYKYYTFPRTDIYDDRLQ
jgi:hypothetical protein